MTNLKVIHSKIYSILNLACLAYGKNRQNPKKDENERSDKLECFLWLPAFFVQSERLKLIDAFSLFHEAS